MASLFTLMGTILVDSTKADESLSKTTSKAEGFAKKLVSGATKAAKWGATVAGAAAAVGAAFAGKALKNAADFEQQMSNVGTLLDGDKDSVKAGMKELGDQVKQTSKDTNVSTELLTDGLYQVISALGDSADSMGILETAAKGAKAGNATVTDSVNLLSAVMKGYGDISEESANKASDLAFNTVKLGQTSFPELAASMGKVIPLASTLNVSQEELFNTYATLTGVTGSTAEVTTQFKATLSGLMSPTKDMAAVMKQLGYESGDAMIQELGFHGSLMALKEAVGGNDIALAKLFSSTEAQTAVMALAGSQAETYSEKLEKMEDATGATDAAFETQTDNLNSRIDSIKNRGDVLLTTIGESLLPLANDVAGWVDEKFPVMESVITGAVDETVGKIEKFREGLKHGFELIDTTIVPKVGKFKDALGKLYEATEPIREAIGNLTEPLTEGAENFDLVAAAVDGVGLVIDLVTAGVELLAEGITAAVETGQAMSEWAEEHQTAMALLETVIAGITAAVLAYNAGMIAAKAASLAETAQVYLMIAAEKAHTIASTAATAASTAFGAAVAFLTSPITLTIAAITALVAAGVLLYKNWDKVKEKASAIWKSITGSVDYTKEKVKTAFSDMTSSAAKQFENLKKSASEKFSAMKNAVKDKIDGAKNIVKSGIDKMKSFFNFKWELPKLKLPHPKITGKFSLDPPSVPSFGIDWYAKAMDRGIIMNRPTAFGINPKTGRIDVGGERGSETVVGTRSLMDMIREASRYADAKIAEILNRIAEILERYLPVIAETAGHGHDIVLDDGMLVGRTNQRLNRIAIQNERGN